MGSRYIISGVQLGILVKGEENEKKLLLKDIYEKQYVGQSDKSLFDDVTLVFSSKMFRVR